MSSIDKKKVHQVCEALALLKIMRAVLKNCSPTVKSFNSNDAL